MWLLPLYFGLQRFCLTRDKRYDFFYKNGVPKWRGTGYYYSRFRPGLGVRSSTSLERDKYLTCTRRKVRDCILDFHYIQRPTLGTTFELHSRCEENRKDYGRCKSSSMGTKINPHRGKEKGVLSSGVHCGRRLIS